MRVHLSTDQKKRNQYKEFIENRARLAGALVKARDDAIQGLIIRTYPQTTQQYEVPEGSL